MLKSAAVHADSIEVEPTAYLNNAAEGWPKAPGVVDAVRRTMERFPEGAGRSTGLHEADVETARSAIAQWLQVEPRCIVFAGSATVGVEPGDSRTAA